MRVERKGLMLKMEDKKIRKRIEEQEEEEDCWRGEEERLWMWRGGVMVGKKFDERVVNGKENLIFFF